MTVFMGGNGELLAWRRLPEGLEGVAAFHVMVADHADDPCEVVVGIETERGLWVQALVAACYQVLCDQPVVGEPISGPSQAPFAERVAKWRHGGPRERLSPILLWALAAQEIGEIDQWSGDWETIRATLSDLAEPWWQGTMLDTVEAAQNTVASVRDFNYRLAVGAQVYMFDGLPAAAEVSGPDHRRRRRNPRPTGDYRVRIRGPAPWRHPQHRALPGRVVAVPAGWCVTGAGALGAGTGDGRKCHRRSERCTGSTGTP